MIPKLLGSLLSQPIPHTPPPPRPFIHEDDAERLEDFACTTTPDCRDFFVDLAPLGRPDGVWLSYDYAEVTGPISADDLAHESELSLAVRLIISEVGADRMLQSDLALMESIGILYTVDNRLDPTVYNPENRPSAPVFPGCGPDGSFYTCTNAQQYLGMSTWRALDPAAHYNPEMLEDAVDLAVLAWYLQERDLISDPTEQATNYVHRCGGDAYGLPTWRCDAHLGRPARDIPNANPHTGPIVFKAPARYLERRGYYVVEISRFIDYSSAIRDAYFDAFATEPATLTTRSIHAHPWHSEAPKAAAWEV
ncbi:MAG: hypothetical protein ACI8RZ_002578 [Myxococcota bacterium]|jgi:hypothetical protein